MTRRAPRSTLFPYTTLFRSNPHTWSETVDRAQKEKLVDELGQIFASSGVVVVAHYAGITVAQMQDLRAKMREVRSEEHTSELQSPMYLVCRLLLEKKKTHNK